LATNNKPAFSGQDEGLWRRVKLIAWNRYFAPDERDAGIFDALLEEREGILAWAVRGAVEWYSGGLRDPDAIVDATREYKATADALAGFLPGVYVRDERAGQVSGKQLFDDFLEWADAENLKESEKPRRRKFYSMLEERGLARHAVREGASFSGLRRARPSDWSEE
jgi:putative DNA primase/helicase